MINLARFQLFVVLLGTLVQACGSTNTVYLPTSPDGGAGAAGDAGPGTAGGAGTSPDGSLKIVSAKPTNTTLDGSPKATSGENATQVVAIVTSTLGLDAIAGGRLDDLDGHTYAAFEAGAAKGTYVANIDWNKVHTVKPISFETTSASREFVIVFFDNNAAEARTSVTINLVCNLADTLFATKAKKSVAAVDGACVDFASNALHCGSVGTVCTATERCVASKCANVVAVPAQEHPDWKTCSEACPGKIARSSGHACAVHSEATVWMDCMSGPSGSTAFKGTESLNNAYMQNGEGATVRAAHIRCACAN